MKTIVSIVILIIFFTGFWAFLLGRALEKNNQEKASILEEIHKEVSPEEWPVVGKDVKG